MPTWPLRHDLHQGPARTRPARHRRESAEGGRAGSCALVGRIAAAERPGDPGDPRLMASVRKNGRTLFGDNCAACHGREARGGQGFPDSDDRYWLWGGDPETVAETIRVGINSAHPDTRVAQMLAFGRDGMLQRDEIESVVAYVRTCRSRDRTDREPEHRSRGGDLCRQLRVLPWRERQGQTGGRRAQSHRHAIWIYGGDAETIYNSVWDGRRGYMPSLGEPAVSGRAEDFRALFARSARSEADEPCTSKRTIWLCVAAGLAVLGAANGHLVYVARRRSRTASRICAPAMARGVSYSAAKSSCYAARKPAGGEMSNSERPGRHSRSVAAGTAARTMEPPLAGDRRRAVARAGLERFEHRSGTQPCVRRPRLPGVARRSSAGCSCSAPTTSCSRRLPASWWSGRSWLSDFTKRAGAIAAGEPDQPAAHDLRAPEIGRRRFCSRACCSVCSCCSGCARR